MSDDAQPPHRNVRGRPFVPGDTRRKNGRDPGTKNKVTMLAEKLMGDDAQAVIQAVIDAAKAGDMQAARMVLERIAALPRDRPVAFDAPPIHSAEDVAQAVAMVLEAVADGRLTPAEGATVAGIVETRRKAIETAELAARIDALEQERNR